MKYVRWIIVILVLLVVVILAVQNYEALATPVMFKAHLIFINYDSSGIPLSLVAIVTFLIGVIFTGVYGIAERFRLKKHIKILTRETREKDRELNSLRNLPVTAEDMSPDQSPDAA